MTECVKYLENLRHFGGLKCCAISKLYQIVRGKSINFSEGLSLTSIGNNMRHTMDGDKEAIGRH